MKGKHEGVPKQWEKYKYVILVALVGVALLIWPESKTQKQPSAPTAITSSTDLQQEMESILAEISGVGQVHVMLTMDTDGERQLAGDMELDYSGSQEAPEKYERSTRPILRRGTEGDEPIVTRTVYPTYRGALIVCQGGDRAEVKLAVTEAVSALTGLPSDRITVAKWQ